MMLLNLHSEALGAILHCLSSRDIEAFAVASKLIARDVIPSIAIWKHWFVRRWSQLNFELHDTGLSIDTRLQSLFPAGTTESRMYHLLTHAITPVPSYADVQETNRSGRYSEHLIQWLRNPVQRTRHAVDFGFAGRFLGGDRCVRSNVPFPTTYHVAVYARRVSSTIYYEIGVAASGYFEITVHERRLPITERFQGSDMQSLGIATSRFSLVDKQPGWDRQSIGYHGDDGNLYKNNSRGKRFGIPFDIGDTVGCGVRRHLQTQESFVYFTNNGDLIPTGDRLIECDHIPWYPVVGLDTTNAIHINFGQEPFKFDEAVDALFDECKGQIAVLSSQLQWYEIRDSDGEDDLSDIDDGEDEEERSLRPQDIRASRAHIATMLNNAALYDAYYNVGSDSEDEEWVEGMSIDGSDEEEYDS